VIGDRGARRAVGSFGTAPRPTDVLEEWSAELEREQLAIREALLDPADDRPYFVYLTNRKAPLAGPRADLSEFSHGALTRRFNMGYTNLWVLQRCAVYAERSWVELPLTVPADPARNDDGGPDDPTYVLLAMGHWPGLSDPWHLCRRSDCYTIAGARGAAADLVDAAERDGFRDVPPLLCALLLQDHYWH
jgi:hypothetical protein